MRIKYDPEVDILVVDLGDLRASVGAREIAPGVWLDLDEHGTVLSLEVLGAKKRYPTAELEKHPPNYEEPLDLARAAHLMSVTPQALQKAIVRGRLRGQKIGKTWFTSIAAITEYQNSRVHKGPGKASDDAQAAGPPYLLLTNSQGELEKAVVDFSQGGDLTPDGTIVPGSLGEGASAIKSGKAKKVRKHYRLAQGPVSAPDLTLEVRMVDGKPTTRVLEDKTKPSTKRRKA